LNLPAGWVEGLAAAGAASAWLMVRRQRRAADPVLPNAVLAAPGVGAGLVTALLTYWTLFGPLVLVPSVLETAGLSPVRAGLLLTALPAGFALGAAVGRRATWGASLAAGALLVSLVVPMREAWLAVLLAVVGVGLGAVAPVNNAQIMRSVPGQLAASAGALLNMTRALGTALGIATVTLADHTGGPRLALATLFATAALAAAIVAVMGRRRPRRIMPDHAARPGRSVVGVPDPSLRG
jgi:MFS family permease